MTTTEQVSKILGKWEWKTGMGTTNGKYLVEGFTA